MSDWTNTFNAVFFLSGASILCGSVTLLLNYCFKSKCSECSFCGKRGLLFIRRDVQAENDESKMEMDHIPQTTYHV
jgi:hypothetical protein